MYQRFFKRIFDIVSASAAIILLSPVLAVVSVLVLTKLGHPILFKQKRPGRNEKIFTLYKFRTMTDQKDNSGQLLPDEIRLTKFGKLLRSTSLDELPELFNIARGDMSIVGPRPLLVEYLPKYNAEQRHRHDVRPGLTGLAQINGRNSVGWEDRFSYDVQYTKKVTFLGDMKILLKTISLVLSRSGINSETAATMESFKGNMNSENSKENK
jgi:lipopolysaccharide/colanic/teichoic acid biosynthesis glycosyltransferase